MKRLLIGVLIGLALTGCGNEDKPAPTAAQAADPDAFKTVSNDMRDIGALTAGECANEAALRRAVERLRGDAQRLPATAGGAEAQGLVDELVADTEDALSSC